MLTHNADSIARGNGHRLGTRELASGIAARGIRSGFWSAQLECQEHAIQVSQVRVYGSVRIGSNRIGSDGIVISFQGELIVLAPSQQQPHMDEEEEKEQEQEEPELIVQTYVRRPLRCSIQRSCRR